ncbi:hypothetical protein C1I95_12230 [Micromonospora craterilacus]|uniref:Uncharacterized protein n=2 Tax=Micromonospora craterilacus TaxID=1655439 RepID=A0A2W2ERF9_9ACTN|nr:hypothetical protein C1I95_12230 [Micromonospora craterilacus]
MVRLAVPAAAMLIAAAGFTILRSTAGIELAARTGTAVRPVTLPAVLTAAAVSALAGWALLALLERLTGRARVVWTVGAVAVLLLSLLAGPTAGITVGAKVGLALLHLAVGAVVIGGMRWRGR